MSDKPTVGFIGLGIMGLAMAKNVKAAGYPVIGYNRSARRRDFAQEEGLSLVASPREVAESSDAIVVMVTDDTAAKEVVMGRNGILDANVSGKTVIQMSTIDEGATFALADAVEAKGGSFIDCPVAGSKVQVEAAQLILLAGAESAVLEKWRDVLMKMGKSVIHAGPVGKGTALKLCMNLIVSQMTTGLCESVALARLQKLDPALIFDVIAESPAINCGYFQIKKKALLENDFTPAFSLSNMLKDVRYMEKAAKGNRVSLPVTQAVRFLMEAGVTEGLGDDDLTGIARLLKSKSTASN